MCRRSPGRQILMMRESIVYFFLSALLREVEEVDGGDCVCGGWDVLAAVNKSRPGRVREKPPVFLEAVRQRLRPGR